MGMKYRHLFGPVPSRRPCTMRDLAHLLGMHINEVNKYLGILEKQGKIESRRQGEDLFYLRRRAR